jgi:crotonobetainyl-CoA:carnitine CoA-transferase CaiB-like acyl-CoA transferase
LPANAPSDEMSSGSASSASQSRRPLAGIRVLDLSHVVSGPYATLVLANLGADVIRVGRGSAAPAPPGADGKLSASEAFEWGMNRNKRSVSINLKSAAGKKILRDLAKQADIVFSNFRPGRLETLGLGNEELRRLNPALITCELNGFGSVGPWASMPAYDPVVQALSGTMSYTGSADPEDMPVRWTVPIGDIFAGLYAVIGMLAALVERRETGRGRHIEVAMHDVMLAMNSYRVPLALSFGELPVPAPNEGGQGTVPYGTFQGSDGKWLAIGVSDRMWESACRVVGREDLLADASLAANRGRWERREEITRIFRDALGKAPAADWESKFHEAGVIAGRVNTIADLLEHPQLRARDMVVGLNDSAGRPVTVIGDPLHWTGGDDVRAPVPQGADTGAILRDLLGFDEGELRALAGSGAIELNDRGEGAAVPEPVEPIATASEPPSPRGPLGHVAIIEMDGDEPSKGFAGRILASLGARVTKITRPPSARREPYPNPKREAAYRASLDAGKEVVPIDIKEAAGRDRFLDLVGEADAVLDNYRAGVLGRLGIGYERLAEANPRIVACSITGYGHTGPWARYPAFDAAIQALGGGMSLAPIPEGMNGEPVRWGLPIGGLNGSLYAVIGILAGLLQRERDGHARPVDIGLLDAQAALLCYRVPQAATGIEIVATPRMGGTGAMPFGPFRTADGGWFVICITQQFWRSFAEVAGAPALAEDPRFATEALRQQHGDELNRTVEQLFAGEPSQVWTERFVAAELPGAPVANLAEAFDHPHVAIRQMKETVVDPEFGPIWIAGNPIKFSPATGTSS